MSKSPPATCCAKLRAGAAGMSANVSSSVRSRATPTRGRWSDSWNFIELLRLLGTEGAQAREVLGVGLSRRDESSVTDHDRETLAQHEDVAQFREPEAIFGCVGDRLTRECLAGVARDEDDSAAHVRLTGHTSHGGADDPANIGIVRSEPRA